MGPHSLWYTCMCIGFSLGQNNEAEHDLSRPNFSRSKQNKKVYQPLPIVRKMMHYDACRDYVGDTYIVRQKAGV